MQKLFTLYRYLVSNAGQEDTPYTTARLTLETLLDTVASAEGWGQEILDQGGVDWSQAELITSEIVEGYKTALSTIYGNSTQAILEFAKSHISLGEYDMLLTLLTQEKEATEKAFKEQDFDSLGDLDDHPF